jgi:hypothetical protein
MTRVLRTGISIHPIACFLLEFLALALRVVTSVRQRTNRFIYRPFAKLPNLLIERKKNPCIPPDGSRDCSS